MVMKPTEGATEFAKHLQSVVRGIANNGVLGANITDTSLKVTPHASINRTVTVAIGECLVNGVVHKETLPTNCTHDAVSGSGNKRRDLIIYDESGSVPVIVKGTEGTDPNPPELADEDDIILAIVEIEYGDALLGAGDITDMRTIIRLIDPDQVIGTTSSPTTTSATPALLPQMTITLTTSRPVLILFNGEFRHSTAGTRGSIRIRIDASIDTDTIRQFISGILNEPVVVSMSWIKVFTAGSHTIEIYWQTDGGTLTAEGIRRCLQIIELN